MDMERNLLLVGVILPPRALDVLGPVVDEFVVETPYGPAGPFARRDTTLLLPYSGLPDRTDPRATLWAAKDQGVTRVLGWDTVIAVNPLLDRGSLLIPDDFIDWTRHQPTTYFERRGLGYLPQMPAFCPQCCAALSQALPLARSRGTYLGFDGPRRETAAEARMFRAWGADVLGLNLVPEVILAKELELCCAGLTTVVEPSSDRTVIDDSEPAGEFRAALRQVLDALPAVLAALSASRTCACAQSQAGPRARGALGADWRTWF
jgi:5'-methylthioadenosine phosphorylase